MNPEFLSGQGDTTSYPPSMYFLVDHLPNLASAVSVVKIVPSPLRLCPCLRDPDAVPPATAHFPQQSHIYPLAFTGLSSVVASREGFQRQAPGPAAWKGPGRGPGYGLRKPLPSKFRIPGSRSTSLQKPIPPGAIQQPAWPCSGKWPQDHKVALFP